MAESTGAGRAMRRLAPFLLLVAVALPAAELPRAKADAIDQLVGAYMTKHGVPGLAIAIVADGQLAWTNAYGLADVENATKVTTRTMFRTASMGKTMTAAAAMQLVESGKLDLDEDIRAYCPAFPAKRWKITPWNLLTHTSGIRHYGGPRDREEQFGTTHFADVAAALAPFKDDPLDFEPGTKFQYSTYGYDVLGCVIEGAAKMPFLTYMRENVWLRAGMTSTRDDDPAAIVSNRASKYTLAGGAIRNAPFIDMSNRMPAGGYLTTASDMGHYVEALLAGRIVKPATFEKMITPAKLKSGETIPNGYGLGWGVEVEPWHDDRWSFHGGSSPGASGLMALMPKHRFGVVFLTNLDELPERNELAEKITRIVLDF